MARRLIATLVVGLVLGGSSPARADRVDDLIKKLENKRNSLKVRLVASLVLRKYLGERVEAAFLKILGDATEDVKLRRWAALTLASQGAHRAIPQLKRLGRSRNATLQRTANKALGRLCPSIRGRRVYADLTRIRSTGTRAATLVATARPFLYRQLQRIRGIAVGLPGCRRPSAIDLRLQGLRGYYLEARVDLRPQAGRFTVKLTVLFTTYAQRQVRGNASAVTAMSGRPDAAALDKAIAALVQSIEADIRRIVRPAAAPPAPPRRSGP